MPRREKRPPQIRIRLDDPLRDAIELAAKKNGLSVNDEAAIRLKFSFEWERQIAATFGGEQIYAVMKVIGGALNAVGKAGHDHPAWLEKPSAYDVMVKTIIKILTVFAPKDWPETNVPAHMKGLRQAGINLQSEDFAKQVLEDLPDRVKQALGSYLQERIEDHLAYVRQARQDEPQKDPS